MKSIVTSLALGAALVAFSTPAAAEEWTHSQDFQGAKTASIRIVEPEGYKVTVDGKEDTVPAVFKFANENNYHQITVTAADGKSWTKKIEVRSYKETVLRVKYTPAAKEPPAKDAKKVRKYIGKVRNKCKKGVALRFDFLLDGEAQASARLAPKKFQDISVPQGSYEVRIFAAGKRSTDWTHWKTIRAEVKADGWNVAPDC